MEVKESRLKKLEQEMAKPEFWQDQKRSGTVIKQRKALGGLVDTFTKLDGRVREALELLDLIEEDENSEMALDLDGETESLAKEVEKFKMVVLLDGPYDSSDAILHIHPGAGGTESQDWAEMLVRLYIRWAERHRYKVETLDHLPGEEAGIKSVTLSVRGDNAYGFLKPEKGVHRLVRISPFDSSGRRHTSFASLDVLPDLADDQEEVEIKPDDIKMDVFRASGAGGQHVNKTSSAVRLTHLPTGIVVSCQNERSQHANRVRALKILKARLARLKEEEREKEIEEIRGDQGEIAWGNQIRSYVLHPYNMVKDHRTGEETGNIQAVLDGDIDRFIMTYLRQRAK